MVIKRFQTQKYSGDSTIATKFGLVAGSRQETTNFFAQMIA